MVVDRWLLGWCVCLCICGWLVCFVIDILRRVVGWLVGGGGSGIMEFVFYVPFPSSH